MLKVAIIGGPSSGKTVLVSNIHALLRTENIDARMVQEYVTDYLIRFEEIQDVFEQAVLMYWARGAEDRVSKSHRCQILLCESPAFSGMPYIYLSRDNALKRYGEGKYVNLLKKMGDFSRASITTFDIIFYLEPVFTLVKDGVRLQSSDEEKMVVSKKILSYLELECPHFISLGKDGREEKLAEIILAKLKAPN